MGSECIARRNAEERGRAGYIGGWKSQRKRNKQREEREKTQLEELHFPKRQ